jgi:hypothetical protein
MGIFYFTTIMQKYATADLIEQESNADKEQY